MGKKGKKKKPKPQNQSSANKTQKGKGRVITPVDEPAAAASESAGDIITGAADASVVVAVDELAAAEQYLNFQSLVDYHTSMLEAASVSVKLDSGGSFVAVLTIHKGDESTEGVKEVIYEPKIAETVDRLMQEGTPVKDLSFEQLFQLRMQWTLYTRGMLAEAQKLSPFIKENKGIMYRYLGISLSIISQITHGTVLVHDVFTTHNNTPSGWSQYLGLLDDSYTILAKLVPQDSPGVQNTLFRYGLSFPLILRQLFELGEHLSYQSKEQKDSNIISPMIFVSRQFLAVQSQMSAMVAYYNGIVKESEYAHIIDSPGCSGQAIRSYNMKLLLSLVDTLGDILESLKEVGINEETRVINHTVQCYIRDTLLHIFNAASNEYALMNQLTYEDSETKIAIDIVLEGYQRFAYMYEHTPYVQEYFRQVKDTQLGGFDPDIYWVNAQLHIVLLVELREAWISSYSSEEQADLTAHKKAWETVVESIEVAHTAMPPEFMLSRYVLLGEQLNSQSVLLKGEAQRLVQNKALHYLNKAFEMHYNQEVPGSVAIIGKLLNILLLKALEIRDVDHIKQYQTLLKVLLLQNAASNEAIRVVYYGFAANETVQQNFKGARKLYDRIYLTLQDDIYSAETNEEKDILAAEQWSNRCMYAGIWLLEYEMLQKKGDDITSKEVRMMRDASLRAERDVKKNIEIMKQIHKVLVGYNGSNVAFKVTNLFIDSASVLLNYCSKLYCYHVQLSSLEDKTLKEREDSNQRAIALGKKMLYITGVLEQMKCPTVKVWKNPETHDMQQNIHIDVVKRCLVTDQVELSRNQKTLRVQLEEERSAADAIMEELIAQEQGFLDKQKAVRERQQRERQEAQAALLKQGAVDKGSSDTGGSGVGGSGESEDEYGYFAPSAEEQQIALFRNELCCHTRDAQIRKTQAKQAQKCLGYMDDPDILNELITIILTYYVDAVHVTLSLIEEEFETLERCFSAKDITNFAEVFDRICAWEKEASISCREAYEQFYHLKKAFPHVDVDETLFHENMTLLTGNMQERVEASHEYLEVLDNYIKCEREDAIKRYNKQHGAGAWYANKKAKNPSNKAEQYQNNKECITEMRGTLSLTTERFVDVASGLVACTVSAHSPEDVEYEIVMARSFMRTPGEFTLEDFLVDPGNRASTSGVDAQNSRVNNSRHQAAMLAASSNGEISRA